MSYDEQITKLFNRLPKFQSIGKKAYTGKLDNIKCYCNAFGNPQNNFKSIHIAGTNGKGSSTHILASILIAAGYKVGIYSSPHILDFRERIKIGNQWIDKQSVLDFIDESNEIFETLQPSFFEVTVAMAFNYFSKQKVDFAIIETGLGGRLDSTNIITPMVSLITNIGYDHQNILGETLEQIATEKAGIIKKEIPVIISEYQEAIASIFKDKATSLGAPITFADEDKAINFLKVLGIHFDLQGAFQLKNLNGVLTVIEVLEHLGYRVGKEAIKAGLENIVHHTGFIGRYQVIGQHPKIICDIAHNEAGIQTLFESVYKENYESIYIIFGAVKDKDLHKMINHLPKAGKYILCEPSVDRKLPLAKLSQMMTNHGINGIYETKTVQKGIDWAVKTANKEDIIVICGSAFLVSDLPTDRLLYTI